jgi:CRP-like cAMP-binding protein
MPNRNRILAALPPAEYARLAPAVEQVDIVPRQAIYRVDEVMDRIFFPLTGVYCEYAVLGDGTTVEVGTIGSEGMVGLPVFFGASAALSLTEGQLAGIALAMTADAFRTAAERSAELRAVLARYTQAHLSQIAQTAACNAVHTVEQRLTRWLLLTHDRVEGDRFKLTQSLLAGMLGTRRETVTTAANRLRRDGLIRYSRGSITVTDRPGLESAACECYRQVAERYRALLRPPVT